MQLEVLYQDERLVAINKPHGLLVHKSPIAADASEFAVQILRDQLGLKVYPVHRLDRKTSGVLLFALDAEMNSMMQRAFMDRKVDKTYLALVRGYTLDAGSIDYPLLDEKGRSFESLTQYQTKERYEIPVASGKHASSRYSLVEVKPETGRMHQIRKHFAHIFHPIIGDRPHGCNKQNKLFLEKWNMNSMLLHAYELKFVHPQTNENVHITAEISEDFQKTLKLFNDLIK